MTRFQGVLIALVAVEVTVVGLGWYGKLPGSMAAGESDQRSYQVLPPTRLNVLDKEAAKDIRRMESKHRPENRRDWLNLAAVYRTFGLLPESIFCYEQAQQRGTLRPKDQFAWGICLSRFGKMRAAEEHLQLVISAYHEWAPDAWLQIGLNYLRQEKPSEAEQALRKGLQRPAAKLFLARLLSRTDRSQEALHLLEELLQDFPNGLRVHQLKAWVHDMEGETAKAAYHRDRVRRATDSLTTHDQSRQQDDRWFQKTGSGKVFFGSQLAEQQGNLKQAVDLGLQGLEASWQEDRALRVVYLLLANGEPGNALLQLERFIARVGESVESLTLMGEALAESGRHEEAVAVWERAAGYRTSRFLDTNMRVHEKLMMAYEKNGEADKASRQKGLMQLERAILAWNRNEVRTAMIELNQAMELVPGSAVVWFYLAEARRLLGDGSGAREAYEKCLQLQPQHGRARHGLMLLGA
ncbi:MAG: tetratricopeptide repeat protein [Pirellulaceae bacterium]